MTDNQVSDVLARAFAAEGVDTLFTLMGDANMYWSAAMADNPPSTDRMPRAQLLRPDPIVVDEIVAMIAEAERSIVIGGRGATWSGAKGALEALAQEAGALLATTLLGKGLFDGNPFALDIAGTFATDLGRELFAESDLVIAAGAGLGHYTTEGGYLFPNP